MEDKRESRSEYLSDGAHLVILSAFTITGLILIVEIFVHGWNKGWIPLVVGLLVYSWCINLIQKLSGIQRVWMYAAFMMLCYFYYGIHQTKLDVLPLAIVVIILIFFITGMRGLIWMAVMTYFFTMGYCFASVDWDWEVAFDITVPKLILQFFMVVLSGIVASFFITERKRERSRFKAEKKDLEEREALAQEQLRVISKELGTKADATHGELLLLREQLQGLHPEESLPAEVTRLLGMSNRIEENLTDIEDYVDSLLGKLRNEPEVYSILDMLAQLKLDRQANSTEYMKNMIIDVDPMIPKTLVGDRNKILKILKHLISNGIRYTKTGGLQMKLYMTSHGDEHNLCIEVNDTGMGIVQTDLERLLEDIDNHRTPGYRPGGLGLGLYLVSEFLKAMGGFFRIESEWGVGTSVCVSIPQRVADAVPCMSFARQSGICLAYESLNYENFWLNRFFEELFYDFSVKLDVPAYAYQTAEELQELVDSYERVCLLVDGEIYRKKQDYYESLEDVYVAVLAKEDFEFPANTKMHRALIPIGTVELHQMLFDVLKTVDRRNRITDEELLDYGRVSAETLVEREIRMHGGRKIMIVTDSMSDLSPELSRLYGIPVIAFRIYTEHASFLDGQEMSQQCALSRLRKDPGMHSMAPDEEDFRAFFHHHLQFAEHLIYVSTAKRVSVAYERACRVAKDMPNVSVFNTGQVSGGVALMALMADEKARYGLSVQEVLDYLEELRPKVKTTFIIDSLDHLAYVGRVSKGLGLFAKAMLVHPVITMKRDAMVMTKAYIGSMARTKEHYMKALMKQRRKIDLTRVFVGSVGLKESELTGIEQELLTNGGFQRVIMRRASAAISINCGVGTFGIIYVEK